MKIPRSSGILLHPTSLPTAFGIGDIGPAAYRFVDFLADSGQQWWQVLPLGPTGYGNSPYMCFSAFAGNPMLISPEVLVADGLLEAFDIENPPKFPSDRVDYAAAIEYKTNLLSRSYERFKRRFAPNYPEDFVSFCQRNAFWLDDYVLFRAVKRAHQERMWSEWEPAIANREPKALERWRALAGDALQFGKYVEYLFAKQLRALREHCEKSGIRIIGDLPIYVAHDSADVWANRDLFHLEENGRPTVIAGVPPDYFSVTGQRWGNPLYRWREATDKLYRWWTERMRTTFTVVDLVRIDHFRGFEAYWEIPASEPTAVHGRWVKGPGAEFFSKMRGALSDLPIIAEDLGVITPEVDELRDTFGFPGMRILQMAFGNDPKASDYRPHSHVPNSVVYTATHDHNTTVGWFTAPPGAESTQTAEEVAAERQHVLEYLGSDASNIHLKFIRMAMGSVANLCIFPLQDLFGLGTEQRMNRPGTMSGNWEWRFTDEMITTDVSEMLRRLTLLFERVHGFPRVSTG